MPLDAGPLPDPRQLWWKAELLKRWDAQRHAAAPIERAEPAQVGIGLAGSLVLLGYLWRYVPALSSTLIVVMLLTIGLVAAAAVFTLRES